MSTARTPDGTDVLLFRDHLMGSRLCLHTYVRFAVAITIALGACVAKYVVKVEQLDVLPLVYLALIICGYNSVSHAVTRRYRHAEITPSIHRRLVLTMYVAIVLDDLALTVAIWLVGGTRSPFLAFYLLHLILSCVYLSRRGTVALAVFAYGLLSMLVVGEWIGVISQHLPVGAVGGAGELDGRFAITVLVVYGLLFGMTVFLLASLARLLRRGEEELRTAHAKLERLSDLRRDFLHVAVHNLRSPIGVTSMFMDHMRNGLGGPVTEQQDEWIATCQRRLSGLTDFLQDLQVLSTFEAGEIEAKKEVVDLGEVLRAISAENQDLAREHEHELCLDVPADLPPVRGIVRLLKEAVVNYLTNAIKYTPDGGRITLRARVCDGLVRVEVEDTGIGISPDEQARLFTEFFRGNLEDTPVAEAPGTGLGLSIVKRVAEAHGGRVSVSSEPGRGSTFVLELRVV
jgi:signal transduction histidine kinase